MSGLGPTLYLPHGASGRWQQTIVKPEDGSAIDLTLATAIEWILKRTPTTADADADLTLTEGAGITVLDDLAGQIQIALTAAQSAEPAPYGSYFYFTRVTFSDGRVIIPDNLRGTFLNDLGAAAEQELDEGCITRLDAATGTLTPATPDMSNYVLNRHDLTGLYGGTAVKLDGLAAATLAELSNGTRLQLGFTNRRVAQYRLRAKETGEVDTSATGQIVVCDYATSRVWELEYVWKDGLPCTWDEVQQLWCPITGYGAAASLLTGFSLPA